MGYSVKLIRLVMYEYSYFACSTEVDQQRVLRSDHSHLRYLIPRSMSQIMVIKLSIRTAIC